MILICHGLYIMHSHIRCLQSLGGGEDSSSFPLLKNLQTAYLFIVCSSVCAIGVECGIGSLVFFSSLLKPSVLQIGYPLQDHS